MKKVVQVSILGILFFGFSLQAQAATPALNFSDLTNGPSSGLNDGQGEGVIITIWGSNLGPLQGTSTITIGGAAPAHIYYWKNADGNLPGGPSDLYSKQKFQEIAFSIPASLGNGTHQIQVTVDGEVSNTLPFLVRNGNIYHAMTTGSVGGDGSYDSPWLSWRQGAHGHMAAGSILYLHNGVQDIGTNSYIVSGRTGTIDNQRALVAYPNAAYLIRQDNACMDMFNSDSYIVSKLKCESGAYTIPEENSITPLPGNTGGTGFQGSPNSRVIANEITDAPGRCSSGWGGAIVASCGGQENCDPISNLKVFGNYIHDWGCNQTSKFEHTTYFSVRNKGTLDVAPMEVAWNRLSNNHAKHGIHFYDETYVAGNDNCGDIVGTTRIHSNYVEGQRGAGINIGSTNTHAGNTCWSAQTVFDIYNNVVKDIGLGWGDENNAGTEINGSSVPIGIRVSDNGHAGITHIYNNTIFGVSDDWTPSSAKSGIAVNKFSHNTGFATVDISNNIIYNTHPINYIGIIEAENPNITGANNLFYGSPGGTIDSRLTGNIMANPQFISTTDMKLQVISPARDKGITTSANKDFLSVLRPQGAAFDIGAYEYIESGATIRADVDQNSTINSTDALLTLRNSLGLNMSSTSWQASATTGDVNCDSNSNSTDALLILRESLGLEMSGTGWCIS